MFNSTEIAERIKLTAKAKKITIKDMLISCSLNKNALFTMSSGGSMPKADNLAKIAEYLDCSVDYLLGRTDNPRFPQIIIQKLYSLFLTGR
ncbi:MAG: helix-turn-helix domain-containing protein [Ruminococcus flavefaciens]|nr:helix-turn-helix domain-containing protein [Ruminococcus flavefaciens]